MADKDEEKNIIIRRIKKVKGGGAHGGAWKVAYADFVTALMAFFLLLWLLAMLTPAKKAEIAHFFTTFSIFNSGDSFLENSGYLFDAIGGQSLVDTVKQWDQMKEASEAIERDIIETSGLAEYVKIDLEKEGAMRIQLLDRKGNDMFKEGSDKLTNIAKRIIAIVASHIKETNFELSIEGHTDARPFSKGTITNWELSAYRASQARREFQKDGIAPERFKKIVGYADKMPFMRNAPNDPRNRRISILLEIPPPRKPYGPGVIDFNNL